MLLLHVYIEFICKVRFIIIILIQMLGFVQVTDKKNFGRRCVLAVLTGKWISSSSLDRHVGTGRQRLNHPLMTVFLFHI